jgi:hypothetical protein
MVNWISLEVSVIFKRDKFSGYVGVICTFDSTILLQIYLTILMWDKKHFDDNLTEISIRVNKLEREKSEVEEERRLK